MRKSFKIRIKREEIPDVCKRFSQFESEFDVGNNRISIDGKCLSSFYALDVSRPLDVECILRDSETLKQIMESFKDYLS